MEPKYCYYLSSCINFSITGLSFCNKLWAEWENYKYNQNFLDVFLQRRETVINNMKQGIVPDHCLNCMYLENLNNKNINNKLKL